MGLKTTAIFAILVICLRFCEAELEHCKTEFRSSEEYEGCKECVEAPVYRKLVKPPVDGQKGLYLCLECPLRALKCYYYSGYKAITIEKCSPGSCIKHTQNTKDDSCELCPPNAISCSWDNYYERVQVTKCEPLYYKRDYSECKKCPDHSIFCTYESGKIIITPGQCEKGYFIDSDENGNICTLCPENLGCVECSTTSKCRESEFNQCRPGFFKSGPDCLVCDQSCPECKGASTFCTKCPSTGQFADGGKCKSCPETITNCRECSKEGTQDPKCNLCDKNYFSNKNGLCLDCQSSIPSCLECDSSLATPKCLDCAVGTFVMDERCATCFEAIP